MVVLENSQSQVRGRMVADNIKDSGVAGLERRGLPGKIAVKAKEMARDEKHGRRLRSLVGIKEASRASSLRKSGPMLDHSNDKTRAIRLCFTSFEATAGSLVDFKTAIKKTAPIAYAAILQTTVRRLITWL